MGDFTTNSFFSGVGGLDLGLERAGFKIVSMCEIEPCSQDILRKHWPEVDMYGDIAAIKTEELEPANVICGGFPCQDVSVAARRKEGLDGRRTGLFFELARIIGEVRPRFVLVENSPMLTLRGLGTVLGDLAALGFDAEWGVLGANAIGANHKRERIWILANTNARPARFELHDGDST